MRTGRVRVRVASDRIRIELSLDLAILILPDQVRLSDNAVQQVWAQQLVEIRAHDGGQPGRHQKTRRLHHDVHVYSQVGVQRVQRSAFAFHPRRDGTVVPIRILNPEEVRIVDHP